MKQAVRGRPQTLVLPKRIRCVIPSLELQPNPLVLFRRLDTLCELLRSLRILSQESFWVCLDQALRLFHKRRLSPLILLYPSKYQGTPPGKRGEKNRTNKIRNSLFPSSKGPRYQGGGKRGVRDENHLVANHSYTNANWIVLSYSSVECSERLRWICLHSSSSKLHQRNLRSLLQCGLHWA